MAWTTTPKKKNKRNIFGGLQGLPIFVQWVPGVCVRSVTSMFHKGYNASESMINSIVAMPHIGQKSIKKVSLTSESNTYIPLLRGITDVPTAGDPVLLCTFGEVNYYLGPLNSDNNPNKNDDRYQDDQVFLPDKGPDKDKKRKQSVLELGYFRMNVKRLHKEPNPVLDYPTKINDPDFLSLSVTPDMILEGRHGNSIRLGSRNVFPYLMISNGRAPGSFNEMSLDGSILSMTETGSLRTHFQSDLKLSEIPNNEGLPEKEAYLFTLADQEIEKVYKSITKTFSTNIGRGQTEAGEHDSNIESTIYRYSGPQTFLNSDRITINARNESMFLISKQFMHIGSGNSMTFSTSNNLLFEAATSSITNVPMFKVNSKEIYIDGKKIICFAHPEEDAGTIESAVKGEHLIAALNSMMDDMKNLAMQVSRAVEGHKMSGASLPVMQRAVANMKMTSELINGIPNDGSPLLSKIVKLK